MFQDAFNKLEKITNEFNQIKKCIYEIKCPRVITKKKNDIFISKLSERIAPFVEAALTKVTLEHENSKSEARADLDQEYDNFKNFLDLPEIQNKIQLKNDIEMLKTKKLGILKFDRKTIMNLYLFIEQFKVDFSYNELLANNIFIEDSNLYNFSKIDDYLQKFSK